MSAPRGPSFAALWCFLALSWAAPSAAQQFPSQQRGLSADTAFQVGAIDQVNLFNGGLTLTLPLTQSYPVGPNLSYGLALTYSSNGWDYEDAECFDIPQMQIVDYHIPIESPHTNAGFGWRIVPGKIVKRLVSPFAVPARYIGPDGSERGFYPELHPGYPSSAQTNTWFSNDASYQRLRYLSSGCTASPGGSSDCYRLDFPDGTVHEFHRFGAPPPGAEEEEWLLTQMTDRFEHDQWVSLDYSTANRWNITDSHGRAHTVVLSGGRVVRLEMAAFGGATAVTSLTRTSTAIARQNFIHPDCDMTADPVAVPLLTRVEMDDGSFYEMSYETQTGGDLLSGGIESLRLRTGGEFRWGYQAIDFNSQSPTLQGAEYVRTAWGVATKELYTEAGNVSSLEGTWTYDYKTVGNPVMQGDQMLVPCFHTVTVTDPLGNDTVNYFDSASIGSWQYGLPYRRCPVDSGTPLSPPYPSQEIWEGSAGSGTLLRTIYAEYDSDGTLSGLHQEKNHRMKLQRVEYEDDPGSFQQTVYSDFDGLGNFREMAMTGNFVGGESRTVVSEYNPGSGTLLINPATSTPLPGNDFVMPSIGSPWVLETLTERRVSEGGDTAESQFCFDESTGFLQRTRVLAGANPSPIDVVRVFEEETIGGQGTGRVAVERTFGGDPGGLGTGSLCTLPLPAQAQNQVEHTYDQGVLESSTVVDSCDDGDLLIVADHDVDQDTGLVATSRDSSGVPTSFVYDTLGRLTQERRQGGTWTITSYQLPTVASPGLEPQSTTIRCPAGQVSCSGTALLGWQRSTYDGLGRQIREAVEYPIEAAQVATESRTFGYNAMGWKTSESLWGVTQSTVFSHDRFGRVTEVDPADTSLATTLLVYTGDRQIERSGLVATTLAGGETRACRRETYDVFGRLVSVREDLSANSQGVCSGSGLLTLYDYDEADRLVHVCSRGASANCVQQRFFNYDNRGFLFSEQHPEIGQFGNAVSSYSYDASGNVLSKDVAGSSDFSLRYRYDPANRLIAVDEVTQPPSTTRPFKRFHYARSNAGTDLRAGKLVLSQRINWVDPVEPLPEGGGSQAFTISQSYRYEGRRGAVSERQTRASLGSGHNAFTTGFTWTPAGNLDQLIYPRCLHEPCAGSDPARTVGHTYLRGFLRRISGYAPEITYQTGGMVHEVEHQNGVTETIATKPVFPMQRPHQISTSGVSGGQNWSSGTYLYDGAGNVKSIGSQGYQYDRMSRLLVGEVLVGAQEKTQSLVYDAFGNILSLTTDGSFQSTPTSSSTNRLTSAGYDAGGNLTDQTIGGETYQYTYDPLNMMKYLQSDTGQARVFLYDADDERIMTFDCAFVENPCATPAQRTTTIRSLDGKVLRVYQPFSFGWNWSRDYVYRDGQLLAMVEPDEDGSGEDTFQFHLDHLGSPRQITDELGVQAGFHTYYPFGAEATDPSQDEVELKFTGHERDANGSGGAGMLDYMHARYYSPVLGRFLAPDKIPVPRSALVIPGQWNRYAYASSNPLKYLDPTGNFIVLYVSHPGEEAGLLELFRGILTKAGAVQEAAQLGLSTFGDRVQLIMKKDFSGSTNAVAQLLASAINTSTRINFQLVDEGLADLGGGKTDSSLYNSKRNPLLSISINPSVVARLRVRGTTLSGPASGLAKNPPVDDNLLLRVSLEAAVVHELGHAFGTFDQGINPRVGGNTAPWALQYENHYRRLSGSGTMRSLQGEGGFLLDSSQ